MSANAGGSVRHKCHHCATKDCEFFGVRRQVDDPEGCPRFTRLDPALRLPRWKNPDGTDKRRIRKAISVSMPQSCEYFIKHCVVGPNSKYHGEFTKGVADCVEHMIAQWKEDGEWPVIPKPVYTERDPIIRVKLTFMPATIADLTEIEEHFKGTPQKTKRSAIIVHCIDMVRCGKARELKKEE